MRECEELDQNTHGRVKRKQLRDRENKRTGREERWIRREVDHYKMSGWKNICRRKVENRSNV